MIEITADNYENEVTKSALPMGLDGEALAKAVSDMREQHGKSTL